jgi:hypothetical protein
METGGRQGRVTGGARDATRLEPQVCFLFFFLLFFSCTNLYFRIYPTYDDEEGSRRVVMTKTGPNDASRVVWAISKFFFHSSVFYHH